METLLVKEKVNSQHQVVIDLPDINAGEEVEIMVFFASTTPPRQAKKQPFNLLEWAEKWESDFGESIRSTDVESFTGRSF